MTSYDLTLAGEGDIATERKYGWTGSHGAGMSCVCACTEHEAVFSPAHLRDIGPICGKEVGSNAWGFTHVSPSLHPWLGEECVMDVDSYVCLLWIQCYQWRAVQTEIFFAKYSMGGCVVIGATNLLHSFVVHAPCAQRSKGIAWEHCRACPLTAHTALPSLLGTQNTAISSSS